MTINHFKIKQTRLLFLLVTLLFLPVTGNSQDTGSLPDGEGKNVLTNRCTVCHGLGTALVKRASRQEWEQTVDKMVNSYSANIPSSEKTVLINYLAEHYNETQTTNFGQQTVANQCFRCHGDGMWQDVSTDRDGWLSVIYRMIGRGGKWTQDQVNVMADYLAETYPQGRQ